MDAAKLTELTLDQGENISGLTATVTALKQHLETKHCFIEKQCAALMSAHDGRLDRLEKNDEREMALIQTVTEMQGDVKTMQMQFANAQQKTDERFAAIQDNITKILEDKEETRKAAASNRAQNWRVLLAAAIGFGFGLLEFFISRG